MRLFYAMRRLADGKYDMFVDGIFPRKIGSGMVRDEVDRVDSPLFRYCRKNVVK